jgi:hypothetical protein
MSMKNATHLALALAMLVVLSASVPVSSVPGAGRDKGFREPSARMEIEQLTTTYAWSVDGKDINALMSIFVAGEPGDPVYPVYDISALQIPGLTKVQGTTAITQFMQTSVIPAEPWAFSSISNVDIEFTGREPVTQRETARGGDYYTHDGYVPAEVDPAGVVLRTYSRFVPSTFDLLCYPPAKLVRRHRQGQHLYSFIKDDDGNWKVWKMVSSPTFAAKDEVILFSQISAARKPWDPMFDAIAQGHCP